MLTIEVLYRKSGDDGKRSAENYQRLRSGFGLKIAATIVVVTHPNRRYGLILGNVNPELDVLGILKDFSPNELSNINCTVFEKSDRQKEQWELTISSSGPDEGLTAEDFMKFHSKIRSFQELNLQPISLGAS